MCFFFQAEDGIRDVAVTGVQTCALPISLRRISERTGGRLIRVNGRQNTAAAFGEIAKELRTEYFLGYSPTNLRHDGSFRKVRVRVTHGNYRVQTRHGYYSPKE